MVTRISLKPKEYAKKTGHSYGKVYRDISENLIPAIRIGRSLEIPMWWINKHYGDPSIQNIMDRDSYESEVRKTIKTDT